MVSRIQRYNISGLRGVVGESLTPVTLYYNLYGFVKYLEKRSYDKGEKKRPRVFIGRDARSSGEAISAYIIGIMNLHGIDVDFGGIIPTPTILHQVKLGKYDGGIAITASHNPIQYNAIKLAKFGGFFLEPKDIDELNSYIDDALSLEKLYSVEFKDVGTSKFLSDAIENHIEKSLAYFDLNSIKNKKIKVAVDFCNSTAANLFPLLFNKLDIQFKSIFGEITGNFSREPEPNKNTMQHLSDFMRSSDFDVGFVFDPDADRVAVIFEDGTIPSEEYTLALSYLHFCKHKGGGDAVVNLSTSSMIKHLANKYGFNVLFAPVGEINVTTKMIKNNVKFGGEGNGGVIYLPISNSRDTLVAVLFILELIAKEGKKISEIAKEIPIYTMKKYKYERKNKFDSHIIEKINKIFTDNSIEIIGQDHSDGVRFEFEEGFCHIRPSNTEPVIRVIVEQQNKDKLEKIENLISEFSKLF